MPVLNQVSLTLHSQFDAAPIPEHLLPAPVSDNKNSNNDDASLATESDSVTVTVTALVPAKCSSQFWIAYTCPAPPAATAVDGDGDGDGDGKIKKYEIRYYFFHLVIAGQSVARWGTGGEGEGEWKGKVVFGLFDDGTGEGVSEKRGLFFPGSAAELGGDGDGEGREGFEVKVFRAAGRRRMDLVKEGYLKAEGTGVDPVE